MIGRKLEQHRDFQKERLWRPFIWCLKIQRQETKVIIPPFSLRSHCVNPKKRDRGSACVRVSQLGHKLVSSIASGIKHVLWVSVVSPWYTFPRRIICPCAILPLGFRMAFFWSVRDNDRLISVSAGGATGALVWGSFTASVCIWKD